MLLRLILDVSITTSRTANQKPDHKLFFFWLAIRCHAVHYDVTLISVGTEGGGGRDMSPPTTLGHDHQSYEENFN